MPTALDNGHDCPSANTEWQPQDSPEPEGGSMQIAIVGMACRLPEYVSNVESFWNLCLKARNTWSEVPKDRFSQEGFYHPNPEKSNCVRSRPLAI